MTKPEQLDDLDFAALISSRICHDVVGPVGGIFNALEVLEDDDDPSVKDYAMDVIQRNTKTAWARLEFARLAFGAGGSAGAEIQIEKIKELGSAILEEKHKLTVLSTHGYLKKNFAKLVLNLVLIGVTMIPRGGVIEITIEGSQEEPTLVMTANGEGARLTDRLETMLSGQFDEAVDALIIQPYFTHRLLKTLNQSVQLENETGQITLRVVSSD